MATIIVNSNFQDNGAPATDAIDVRVTSDTNGDTITPAQLNLNITRISR